MATWTEEYRPQSLDDIRGNSSAVSKLKEWADEWEPGDSAVILHGPPGTGKTSAARLIGKRMNWEVVEQNASEERSRDKVEEIAGEGTASQTLFSQRRLLLVDEADSFSSSDRGGERALTEISDSTGNPLILISNDLYAMNRSLRNKCETIEFERPSEQDIALVLRDICEDRDIGYSIDSLRKTASQADGDVRAAINLLQTISVGRDEILETDVRDVTRDSEEELFEFLDSVLKEKHPEEARSMAMDVDEDPWILSRWVEENMPKVYKGKELSMGYSCLSKADIWLGRVTKTQEYRYWKYTTDQMAAGVAASREGRKSGWTRYSRPSFRSRDSTLEEVARKIAEVSGTSIQVAFTEIIPYLSTLIEYCKPEKLAVQVAARYELDEEELAKISGSGKDTNKVERIIEKAEERRLPD